jgi:hypothetical protein
MIEVEWFTGGSSLSEIYQSTKMQFAFLSPSKDGKAKQCHPFALCRDFLHDAVRSHITKKPCNIYGFHYGDTNPPIDMKHMRVLVKRQVLNTPEGVDRFEKSMKMGLKLLQHYESIAGWTKSKLVRVQDKDKPNVWLFMGPVGWMKSPYLVSMYTFIIRLGDKHEQIGKFKTTDELVQKLADISTAKAIEQNDNDSRYLKTCANKLHVVMENIDKLFLPGKGKDKAKIDPIYNDSGHSIGTFHNNCGIVSLCNCATPNQKLNKTFKEMTVVTQKK